MSPSGMEAIDTRQDARALDAAEDPNHAFMAYLEELRQQVPAANRLLLIHCPTFNFDSFNLRVAQSGGYYAYPPTGLQCLQAALRDMDLEVEIVDLNYKLLERASQAEPTEDPLNIEALLDACVGSNDAALVGVSAGVIVSNIFAGDHHPYVRTLRYFMRTKRCLVLTGGVIATNEWKNILQRGLAHFVFEGESEDKLRFFLGRFLNRTEAPATPGIHFKYGSRLRETRGAHQPVAFTGDLIPTYDRLPIERYHQVGCLSPFSRAAGADRTYATVQLNRGCRGRCTFCGVIPFMGTGVRTYPVEAVMSEIAYLVRERGVRHLEWLDDDLLANRATIVDVFRRMKELQLDVTWAANNGLIAASLDEDLLKLMVESGCIGFRLGIESGNAEVLRRIRKPASLERFRVASRLLEKFPGLFTVGCYIIGFEGETFQQMLDTFRLSLDMNLSWSGFSVFQPLRTSEVDGADSGEEFETCEETRASSQYRTITDFVPSKGTAARVIASGTGGAESVFTLANEAVPSRASLQEIWFAFNLCSNYIFNKHLKPGGLPEQFIWWLKAIQVSYPTNAAVSLFLGLAHLLHDDPEAAREQCMDVRRLLEHSAYWAGRFSQFGLTPLMERMPGTRGEAQQALHDLRGRWEETLASLSRGAEARSTLKEINA